MRLSCFDAAVFISVNFGRLHCRHLPLSPLFRWALCSG